MRLISENLKLRGRRG